MGSLTNHPGKWLRDDAAAAFNEAEAKHGRQTLTSAGRTVAEQQALLNRWARGGAANRPPFLYQPKSPASASNHVANGGIAVDIGGWRAFALIAAEAGFSHPYPGSDPVHFEFVGKPNAIVLAGGASNQDVLNRQRFLNSIGFDLVEDGRPGPRTRSAIAEYQKQLKAKGLYAGAIDGDWGPKTEDAHRANVNASAPRPAGPAAHVGTVADLRSLGDTRGLQKVARIGGYRGGIDNDFGGNSQAGLQTWLNRNYGGSLPRWLRAKWGYRDSDNFWGPNMAAAAARANAANFRAL